MTPRSRTEDIAYDWRRYGAGYQVYPRSFADASGDGIGDLAGLTSRLNYINSLGVDTIWISPWYPSSFRDGGYDVTDYRDIHPWFGGLGDAQALLSAASRDGLKVILDLVVNHTSNEHPWFRDAVQSPPGSEARRRYHVLRGRGSRGELPPNNWESVFGGSAWTPLGDGDWYLHLFDSSQPDLNWANPSVYDDVAEIMRYWVDLGVSGFRVDSAQFFAKDPDYPDWRGKHGDHVIPLGTERPYTGRPELHDIVRSLRMVLDEYSDRELLFVAENIVSPWQRQAEFLRPGEFNQIFNFEFLETPWDETLMRAKIGESIDASAAVGAVPTWTLSNHDAVRPATRFGLPVGIDMQRWLVDGDRSQLDVEAGFDRARAGAMMAMALPGSYYCFQGEELGLPEVIDLPPEVLDDPIFARSEGRQKGRDGCRVPIPWTEDGPSCGFGPTAPWLPQPLGWGNLAVQRQSGVADSTLELFRHCLHLRAKAFAFDDFEWVPIDGAIAFQRRNVVSVTNFADHAIALPNGTVLASSVPLADDTAMLPVDASAWVDISVV